MPTAEHLIMLRAMVDGDFERHSELSKALNAAGELNEYGEVIGAAFYVAVRRQFPERYSSEDVIRLVADARAMFDQTGDVINPRSAELVVRGPLGEYEGATHVPDEEVVQAQVVVCSYLAAEDRLGDPEVFMGEVQRLLDEWAADDEAGAATQGDKPETCPRTS
jgi:hypothetical protein